MTLESVLGISVIQDLSVWHCSTEEYSIKKTAGQPTSQHAKMSFRQDVNEIRNPKCVLTQAEKEHAN